jgi:hypothetical protein
VRKIRWLLLLKALAFAIWFGTSLWLLITYSLERP